jgi:hypothetical protein
MKCRCFCALNDHRCVSHTASAYLGGFAWFHVAVHHRLWADEFTADKVLPEKNGGYVHNVCPTVNSMQQQLTFPSGLSAIFRYTLCILI